MEDKPNNKGDDLELSAFINELHDSIKLPLQVKGTLAKNEHNSKLFINLVNIKNLNGSPLQLKNGYHIRSVFVDKVSPIDFNKLYSKILNKEVYATIVFNNRETEKRNALKKRDFIRLLNVDKNSIDTAIPIDSSALIESSEGYLIKESIYNIVLNDLKKDFGIPEYVQSRDDLSAELSKIEFAIKEVENRNNLLTDKVIKKEKKSEELTSLTTEKSNELINLKARVDEQKQQHNEGIKLYNEQLGYLRKYRLIKDDASNNNLSCESSEELLSFNDFSNYSKLIDYIHGYILAKGIYYTRETILEFFALVKAHDFVVLAGQSGVGKTSIVKEFARAVNAKAYIIPVKPNWMSKEDLLGYYNPIQKQYIPTEFLDALLEAEKNPSKPYFICLDEMNLARVEYYFADFLSKLEDRDRLIEIQLYSESLYPDLGKLGDILSDISPQSITSKNITKYKNLIAYIDNEYGLKNSSSEDYHKLYQQLVPSTPPSITIGDNVHFFGTANIDETTHYFSEKVLDRMQVLKFSNPLKIDTNDLDKTLKNYAKRKPPFTNIMEKSVIVPVSILGKKNPYPNIIDEEVLKEEIVKLYQDYLEKINISIGWRIIRQSANYLQHIRELNSSSEDNYKIAFNSFMRHKILPRISIHTESELEYLEHLGKYLEKNYEEYEVTKELQDIISRAKNNNFIFNYWSR